MIWCFSNPAIRPPPAIFCSTRIPFPIPAKGLPATQCNNWKQTMKLYLHRNEVTCRRLQCRTPISFVFNQNEKFCWGRLFSECSWLAYEYVCVCVCVFLNVNGCMFHYLPLSCFPFSVLVSALRWLHFKLDDRSQHEKSCKWLTDGKPICWELNCFLMAPLFLRRGLGLCTDLCRQCAGDIFQSFVYNQLCLFKNSADFTSDTKKKNFILALFFLLIYHVVSWLLTET